MRPAATPRWAGDAQVRVAVWAEMAAPRARVIDNTDAGSLYGVLSPFPPEPPIDAAEAGTHDVRLSADWGPAGFDGPRVAGPFALLDTARTASQAVLAARPGLALVPLTIQWSVLNDRCNGDDAAGCIGTSHWDGRALSILGKADVDTDEFDAHVVAHEWTHALEATVGRADSIGGSHSSGQLKDPRLAFGEGLASGVAAMVLHPDPVYIDTTGVGASRGFFQDMQDNSRDRNPGWFSEATVRTFLYDLFDDDDEPGDAVALGLGASSTPCWAGTPSKLRRFRRSLARGRGEGARRSRRHRRLTVALLAAPACEIGEGLCGLDPVQDAWGTGETHSGGLDLPVYLPLGVGAPVDVALRRGGDPDSGPTNWLTNTRALRFEAADTPLRVRADCPPTRDVDLFVYRRGEGHGIRQRDFHRAEPGDWWIDVPAEPGQPLVALLRGPADDGEPYTCRVTLEALP
ncbi:MAG: hypothetical protein R3F60_09705 [bacterium]